MNHFFLYRHIRLDINVPFYIGIGKITSSEVFKSKYNRAFNFKKRSAFWKNVFEKSDKNIEVEILYESELREEIENKEKEFIALYGRNDLGNGPLVNLTDGGDKINGISSKILSDKQKNIWKQIKGNAEKSGIPFVSKKKGTKIPEEVKQKISESLKGRKVSNQTKEKLRQKHKGKKLSEEHKKLLSIVHQGKKISIEKRNFGFKQSPETIQKRIKSLRGKLRTNEQKAKISQGLMGRKFTEEHKKKLSESKLGKTKVWETRRKNKAIKDNLKNEN